MKKGLFAKVNSSCDDCERWFSVPNSRLIMRKCGWLQRVTRNLVINWMKHGQRHMIAFGGPESQSLFADIAADDCPESIEFDTELRRSTFQRAFESVRQEPSPKNLTSVWRVAFDGKTPAIGSSAKKVVVPRPAKKILIHD